MEKERGAFCALTNIRLGIAERQVVVVAPCSVSGRDGRWELREVARVNGDIFDAVAARLGYEGGRITGIEAGGRVWPAVVRRFYFQTFVAVEPLEKTTKLVAGLPFLASYVQDTRRCMTGGDEWMRFLRGTGSTRALRPAATLVAALYPLNGKLSG